MKQYKVLVKEVVTIAIDVEAENETDAIASALVRANLSNRSPRRIYNLFHLDVHGFLPPDVKINESEPDIPISIGLKTQGQEPIWIDHNKLEEIWGDVIDILMEG
jgi:hypothetical protein